MKVVLSDKSGPCKHGGIKHYSKVKTVISIEHLEKYCSVLYWLPPPAALVTSCSVFVTVWLQGCEYVVGLVYFIKLD